MRYLLDTNILSNPVKTRPHPGLLERLVENRRRLCTAAPVWHELLYGVERLPSSERRRKLETYLRSVVSTLPILSYDREAAEWHGFERARLSRVGRTPPAADGQIAAIAHVHGLTVVTQNVRDFEIFDGLDLENWLD